VVVRARRATRPEVPTGVGRLVVAAAVIATALTLAISTAWSIAAATTDLALLHPPLATIAPVVDAAPSPRLAQRVLLIIVDGLREASSHGLPTLDRLRALGTSTIAHSHYPTWSRPNYVSILSGVPPADSGVRTNRHSTPVPLDSLMDRARASGLDVALATDYEVLPRLFLRRRGARRDVVPEVLDVDIGGNADIFAREAQAPAGDYESAFDEARYSPWPGGFVEAGTATVAGNAELDVMLVGIVDTAGHEHGGASAEYAAAAREADRAIAKIIERADLDRDAVIVTADHGHTDRGGHGDVAPDAIEVPLVMAGAGIRRGAAIDHARLIDIAPTVAALLGIAAPGHGLGRTLVETLDLDRGARASRLAADHARLAVTEAVVAAGAAAVDVALSRLRTTRITIAVAAIVLAITAMFVFARRRLVWLSPSRVAIAIAGNLAVAATVVVGLAGWGGPLMASKHDATVALVRYGIVAIVALHGVTRWCLRWHGDQRLAGAIATSCITLAVAFVPATLAWIAFPDPAADLPGPAWLALLPATGFAAVCAAAHATLALAAEVHFGRSRDVTARSD
jgi:Type I phosphodiesterase / nucleotide pyrophosphatase